MDFNYLKEIRKIYENSNTLLEVVFIMGNNTCDMDSVLSAYLLSLGKNIKKGNIIINKEGNPIINSEIKILYLPVLNIKRGTLPYRVDVKYVFDFCQIDENDFWYISDEIFNPNKLFQHKNNKIRTSLILVDHTILIEELKYLSEYVEGIYDHHLLSNYNGEYKNLKSLNIVYPVGSCTTLILQEFFKDNFPNKILSPKLAVTAILLDTKKFNDDLYENRWIDLDRNIYKKIKKVIKNQDDKFKTKIYYEEINNIKYDIKKNLDLGLEPLFLKDIKFYNWNNGQKAIWSSLHIPINEIKKKFGDTKILNYYLDHYKLKVNEEKKNTFYVTNSPFGNKQRLFTIFNPIKIPFNKEQIKNELNKYSNKDLYELDLHDVFDDNNNSKGQVCYILLDHTHSRKSLEPILKLFFSRIKSS